MKGAIHDQGITLDHLTTPVKNEFKISWGAVEMPRSVSYQLETSNLPASLPLVFALAELLVDLETGLFGVRDR